MKKLLVALGAFLVLVVVIVLAVGVGFSGKTSVQRSLEVQQKPEKVFEVLTAFKSLPELGVGVKEVTLPPDQKPGPGYKFSMSTEYGEAQIELTDWQEGRAAAGDLQLKGTKIGNVSLEIVGSDAGRSDVSLSINLDSPPPLGGIYNLAARKAFATALDSNREKLQEFLEAASK